MGSPRGVPLARICLIVRARAYDQAAVLTALLQRGYSPVETGPESLEAVLATVVPEVAIVVVDPATVLGVEMIRRAAETGAFVILLAPDPEFFSIGLTVGADACLEDQAVESTLPAQLAAAERRRQQFSQPEQAGFLPLGIHASLDLDGHRLVTPLRTVPLTPSEYALLETLARNPGRVLSSVQLADAVKGLQLEPRTAAAMVKVYILRLRKKFAAAGISPSVLRTVRAVGYMIDRA